MKIETRPQCPVPSVNAHKFGHLDSYLLPLLRLTSRHSNMGLVLVNSAKLRRAGSLRSESVVFFCLKDFIYCVQMFSQPDKSQPSPASPRENVGNYSATRLPAVPAAEQGSGRLPPIEKMNAELEAALPK